jgi:hypothetical protein
MTNFNEVQAKMANLMTQFLAENEAFATKRNKAAALRARQLSGQIGKLGLTYRKASTEECKQTKKR